MGRVTPYAVTVRAFPVRAQLVLHLLRITGLARGELRLLPRDAATGPRGRQPLRGPSREQGVFELRNRPQYRPQGVCFGTAILLVTVLVRTD